MSSQPTIKANYPVLNMSCASCAVNVQSVLKKQKGVKDAAVNFAQKSASVEFTPDLTNPAELKTAVKSAGYDLIVASEEEAGAEAEDEDRRYQRILATRTIVAVLLSVPIVVIGMFFTHLPHANLWMWALSTPIVWWCGLPFFVNAIRQARHRSVNMDTLVALSTGVTYLFSVFNTLFPGYWLKRGIEPHVYFEAAAVVVTFLLLGKLLEEKAKGNTSSAIRNLMGLQPKFVLVMRDNNPPVETPIIAIRKGDRILVRPGERIAVDGTVSSGYSFVDESSINGEPLPAEKTAGSQVYAGTTNQQGSFQFAAEHVGTETLLAQIIRTVKEAQGSRAPVQRLVDKVAGIFVPVVIGVSVLSLVIWSLAGGAGGFTHGLLAMVTVLVIACPCALGLATPTAIIAGVGAAATSGILIRDAEGLETLAKTDTIVLDKTGTVTEGRPQVTDLIWLPGGEGEANALAAIEHHSEHPLAAAILRRLGTTGQLNVTAVENLPGSGIKARIGRTSYWIGNARLMEAEGVLIPQDIVTRVQAWEKDAKTAVYFARETEMLAAIAITDQLKPTTTRAVAEMQRRGFDVHLLTGDTPASAESIARQAGITTFKASALPGDKVAYIRNLQASGKNVAMVGDGINDSGALAQADTGIAMGKGADIAMEVARITIISSDLARIPLAIRLSERTVATIRQNLFWAFIYNVIGIPVAAGLLYPLNGFLLNPMIAGAAMGLSSLSVVMNSLRLTIFKPSI
jgi:P-type Cu2+ transporter